MALDATGITNVRSYINSIVEASNRIVEESDTYDYITTQPDFVAFAEGASLGADIKVAFEKLIDTIKTIDEATIDLRNRTDDYLNQQTSINSSTY